MTVSETKADICEDWIKRRPFVPFVVHTTNGRSFEVPHPDFIHLMRTALAIFKPDSDSVSFVSLIHVNEFEALGGPVEMQAEEA